MGLIIAGHSQWILNIEFPFHYWQTAIFGNPVKLEGRVGDVGVLMILKKRLLEFGIIISLFVTEASCGGWHADEYCLIEKVNSFCVFVSVCVA